MLLLALLFTRLDLFCLCIICFFWVLVTPLATYTLLLPRYHAPLVYASSQMYLKLVLTAIGKSEQVAVRPA
jgi:hypothetical protein